MKLKSNPQSDYRLPQRAEDGEQDEKSIPTTRLAGGQAANRLTQRAEDGKRKTESNFLKSSWMTNILIGAIGILAALAGGIIIAKFGAVALLIIPLGIMAAILAFYILRNPFLGFLLIIFFLPFERVPTYNVGGLDLKINVLLGFLTILCWILALMFNFKKYKIQPNALTIPLSFFIIGLVLSLAQAQDLNRAIVVLFSVLFTISLSILALNMIQSREDLEKVVRVLLFSSFIVAGFSFFQFGGDVLGLPRDLTLLGEGFTSSTFGFPRIQAFSMEPLYLANYLMIPIFLASAYFLGGIKIIKQWWLVLLLVMLLIIFVLTVSRGAYIGLAVGILVFIIFYFRKIFSRKTAIILVILAFVFAGVSFALTQSKNRAAKEFIGHVTINDYSQGESVQSRLNAYKDAYKEIKKYPVLGQGLGNYGPWYKGYPSFAPKTGWAIVNNEYIELLFETGIVGFAGFGLIMIVLIIRSIMALKRSADPFLKATMLGLLAALIGILVQYNFFSTLYIIHIWVLVGVMVGVQNIIMQNAKVKMQDDKEKF